MNNLTRFGLPLVLVGFAFGCGSVVTSGTNNTPGTSSSSSGRGEGGAPSTVTVTTTGGGCGGCCDDPECGDGYQDAYEDSYEDYAPSGTAIIKRWSEVYGNGTGGGGVGGDFGVGGGFNSAEAVTVTGAGGAWTTTVATTTGGGGDYGYGGYGYGGYGGYYPSDATVSTSTTTGGGPSPDDYLVVIASPDADCDNPWGPPECTDYDSVTFTLHPWQLVDGVTYDLQGLGATESVLSSDCSGGGGTVLSGTVTLSISDGTASFDLEGFTSFGETAVPLYDGVYYATACVP